MPPKTPASANFRLADITVDGRLVEILTAQRAAGVAYDVIARTLFTDHGIDVTGQTLRRWCADLEIADQPTKEAVG